MADKLPFLPDEHHYAIAAVATRAAQLDAHIEVAVSSFLSDMPGAAKFILKNMNGDKFVGLLEELLLDYFPGLEQEISETFTGIRSARRERNEIMHWLWGRAETGEPMQASIRPFRDRQSKTRTADDIQLIAEHCLSAVHQITLWMQLRWKREAEQQQPSHGTPEPLIPLGHSASALGSGHSETPEQPDPQPPPFRE